jgi:hypothetical protein
MAEDPESIPTNRPISPLRPRMIEGMAIRRMASATQNA